PPIRTFTVGSGFSPDPPADGFGRVADFAPPQGLHRRFGVSPTPEHACTPSSVPCAVKSALTGFGPAFVVCHKPGARRAGPGGRQARSARARRCRTALAGSELP